MITKVKFAPGQESYIDSTRIYDVYFEEGRFSWCIRDEDGDLLDIEDYEYEVIEEDDQIFDELQTDYFDGPDDFWYKVVSWNENYSTVNALDENGVEVELDFEDITAVTWKSVSSNNELEVW